MHILRNAAVGISLGAAVALGTPFAPAQAADQTAAAFCAPEHWQDEYTYGGRCVGSETFYYAAVPCENGAVARGPAVRGSTWSYAYCGELNSRIRPGARGDIYPL
ncbi:hypothetical protein ABGB07_01600 [Micromonosporaceae bacterium B7E4]